jgi:hypothetical protein
MAIDIDAIVKRVVKNTTESSGTVRVTSGEAAKTKSGSGTK